MSQTTVVARAASVASQVGVRLVESLRSGCTELFKSTIVTGPAICVCVAPMEPEPDGEEDVESDVAVGTARRAADAGAKDLFAKVNGGLKEYGREFEELVMQWRASPKGEDRQ